MGGTSPTCPLLLWVRSKHPCFDICLTLALLAGRFFHRRRWTRGVHRTIPRPVRRHSRPSRCCQRFAIPCRFWAHRRTIISGSNARIRHVRAVAADRPPDAGTALGSHRGIVRSHAAVWYPTERVWGVQLAGALSIPGACTRNVLGGQGNN